MSEEEINVIRDRSSAYQASKKYGKPCPWTTDYTEMCRKTVFRRCSKWLPLSPELRSAIEVDDSDYTSAAAVVHAADDKFAQAIGAVNSDATDAEATVVESEPVEDSEKVDNLFGNEVK